MIQLTKKKNIKLDEKLMCMQHRMYNKTWDEKNQDWARFLQPDF